MAIGRLARRVVRKRFESTVLYECRACGTSQFAPMGSCPTCASTDIIEFAFE